MSDRFTLWRNAIQSVCDSGAPLNGPSLIVFLADVEYELTALREKCEELQAKLNTAIDALDEANEGIARRQGQLDEAAKQEPVGHRWRASGAHGGWGMRSDLSQHDVKVLSAESLYAKPVNLPALIEQERAEEREECAKLADAHFIPGHVVAGPQFAAQLSAAIRARSGKTE